MRLEADSMQAAWLTTKGSLSPLLDELRDAVKVLGHINRSNGATVDRLTYVKTAATEAHTRPSLADCCIGRFVRCCYKVVEERING